MSTAYFLDPTANDSLSQVRGIGRYLQTLRENFTKEAQFVNDIKAIPYESTFINPFFDLLKPPVTVARISRKQVAVIHDLIPIKYAAQFPIGLRGKLNIFLNRIALLSYDVIVTDSEASKEDIKQLLNIAKEKIKVIYPILSSTFSEKITLKTPTLPNIPQKYIIYVGDATWNKNLVNIAKAIKLANVNCLFVGKVFHNKENLSHPWQKELKEFFEEVNNDSRFIFPGYISNEQLMQLYQHASFNILISRDEGFGYSFVEAAACGVPSILADRPIFHETAQDSALFAHPEKPEEIVQQITSLWNDSTLQKKLSEKAKERCAYFSREKFKNDFLSIL